MSWGIKLFKLAFCEVALKRKATKMSDFSRILNLLVYASILACVKCGRQGRQFVVRETKYGTVRGFVDHVHSNHKVEKYLGVPFASPPVGNLRFEVSDHLTLLYMYY